MPPVSITSIACMGSATAQFGRTLLLIMIEVCCYWLLTCKWAHPALQPHSRAQPVQAQCLGFTPNPSHRAPSSTPGNPLSSLSRPSEALEPRLTPPTLP
ncbi:hypothetical protein EDB81DRAFT_779754 [Dactylonectria macrodidyma]|uniref:Uncharacterized protein n=1 Tax=Dactylonectria macrodidyma TaxID=307937 RepID=A0A9P9FN28_9HYPO|nr:hypothetical protein EDB81DRAFT_779754 [Dactylonectria macrodidyma]